MTQRKLVSLHVSPWSERAKWALDHHGLAYEVVEHVPIVGERRLRRLVGSGKRRATVPVLIDGDQVVSESWDIALYADGKGSGARLIPPGREEQVRRWASLADQAMESGRALVLAALLASPAALDEASPPFVPRPLRPLLRPVARRLVRGLARKYDLRLAADADHTLVVRKTLETLRKALAPTAPGAKFLLGSFTFADIAMATLLQGISPVDARFIRLGRATRAAWTRPALAAEYADLVAWRDALYERRGKPRRGGDVPAP